MVEIHQSLDQPVFMDTRSAVDGGTEKDQERSVMKNGVADAFPVQMVRYVHCTEIGVSFPDLQYGIVADRRPDSQQTVIWRNFGFAKKERHSLRRQGFQQILLPEPDRAYHTRVILKVRLDKRNAKIPDVFLPDLPDPCDKPRLNGDPRVSTFAYAVIGAFLGGTFEA